ncbi:MAG: carboxylesterase family protein [Pseudonocardiaceae bacterium]
MIRVTGGEVRGLVDGPVRRFAGIPFAAPPVGPRRWAPPAPAIPWPGVWDVSRPARCACNSAKGLLRRRWVARTACCSTSTPHHAPAAVMTGAGVGARRRFHRRQRLRP